MAELKHVDDPIGSRPAGPSVASARQGRADAGRPCVLFVDPKPLTRDCIAPWLRTACSGADVAAVADVPDPAEPPQPDLAVFYLGGDGVSTPWVRSGLEAVAAMAGDGGLPPPTLLIGRSEAAEDVQAAIALGLSGYIPASLPIAVVEAAVRLVLAGGRFFPPVGVGGSAAGTPRGDGRALV